MKLKNTINILSKEVINQIAAGEVIQRPASIIKELVENSIDAQAENITILIKNGGKSLVQIIDDGVGMNAKDAEICFDKHTTSKIKTTSDIMEISTMGFRGEALASIASISEVELKTKTNQDEIGTMIIVDNSKIRKNQKIATSKGTSISVKNLFFNIPARKNFLKSDKVEMKHILETFIKLAISNYDIGFKLMNNNQIIYNLSKSNLKKRIIQLFGKKYNEKILPLKEHTSIVSISGFIGNPLDAKKTRGEQFLYVNNRFIKSQYLNHAVKNAMHNIIRPDQHPSYFIFLTVPTESIDINIHPNKTEIKFQDEQSIYQILKSTCKKAIGIANIIPSLDFTIEEAFEVPAHIQKSIPKEPKLTINKQFNPFEKGSEINENNQLFKKLFQEDESKHIIENIMHIDENYALFTILIKNERILHLIEKRKALQRIIYEQIEEKLNKQTVLTQMLINPYNIEVNTLDMELIKENIGILNNLGYKINFISKTSLEIIGIPTKTENYNLKDLFEEFLEELKNKNTNINNKLISKIATQIAYQNSKKSDIFNIHNKESLKNIINMLLDCKTPFIGINGKPCVINIEPNTFFD